MSHVTGGQARDTPGVAQEKLITQPHHPPELTLTAQWVRQEVLSAAVTSLLRGLQRAPRPQGRDYRGNANSTRREDRGCEALGRKA